MSKDYPCVYWNDGKCKKFSDDKVTSWCVWSPCASQTPSNADRIRSMSDEELASMLKDYKDCSKNCIISNGKHCYQICEEESVLLKWLQQPAEEADNETD